MSRKKIIIISVVILLFAVVITSFIFFTEPTAQSEGASKEMAMLVQTTSAEAGSYSPELVATGTVMPVNDVSLSARVGGEVSRRDPQFVPGGSVRKGQVLLQIDPADYRNALELRRSELMQAQTELEVEMGRQEVAQQDLKLVGAATLSEEERSLVLRQPQLNAVKARIKAAQAAVDQAQLNLSRTTIRAPFDAHIITQNVTTGSQVAPGVDLGRLVGTETYRVVLSLPVSKLQWLSFPTAEEEKGSMVKIRNTSAWPESSFRTGFLSSMVGALDDQSRLARILVEVPDPLAQDTATGPELLLGSFVEAKVQAQKIDNVVRLDRDHLRKNNTVWVMQDGKLDIRDVQVLLTDHQYVYIDQGLTGGETVVTTNLSTVANGIPLRTEKDSTAKAPQD
ncbi:efflux RND transporter periplasmic adaptor subunit [Salinimicrobium oceani]|uniref:Efflux RND transporter periplasmic adaptor subunit n=1 Tax=Salinimicrobium oceani TaxID=2722702 RepID=A0ABX1CVP1_9FLAO|nr:efflux RND transporter periplasmic adaptor subunit [Salinimicrobium oceani]NJW51817.1 efflux RND transporter periplasmic adaptor subunit [Salinimicrobium oceani]